jgi:hypothetical protein
VRLLKGLLFCGLMIALCLPVLAQQTDVNRYTLFTGFDYMISPARNLTERGFETDFGVTVRPWLGLGADFGILGDGIISGAGTIYGGETIYAPLLLQVPPPFGPIPPNSVKVPFKSQTYTFAAGPQFYLRKWEKVTFFARPGFGGIHERADIAFPVQLGQLFQLLNVPVPAAHQTDTTYFVGLGGGFDLNVSRKVGIRFAGEHSLVYQLADATTELRSFLLWPDFPLGSLEVTND